MSQCPAIPPPPRRSLGEKVPEQCNAHAFEKEDLERWNQGTDLVGTATKYPHLFTAVIANRGGTEADTTLNHFFTFAFSSVTEATLNHFYFAFLFICAPPF
jgi:hypothetical protein